MIFNFEYPLIPVKDTLEAELGATVPMYVQVAAEDAVGAGNVLIPITLSPLQKCES